MTMFMHVQVHKMATFLVEETGDYISLAMCYIRQAFNIANFSISC